MINIFLDAAAAFAVGTLAGIGVGGGGLLVIYLVLFRHINQIEAQGINLAFFVLSAAASLPIHLKKRRFSWFTVITLSASGLIGAWIGSSLAKICPPDIVRKCFGGLLIFSGLLELFSKKEEKTR